MANALPRDMTADKFLLWNLEQDRRYELVDGVPVPLRAMAGASNVHDDIVTNVIIALGNKLRGTGCRPRTADSALRIAIENVRRPDVTVDCAPSQPGRYESNFPVAAFEVLSPSTRKADGARKLHEYQRHPTLRTIVHIDPDVMDVVVYTRSDGDDARDWAVIRATAPTDAVAIAGTAVVLTLADIYDGVPVAAGDGAAASEA